MILTRVLLLKTSLLTRSADLKRLECVKMEIMTTKRCFKCGAIKPIDDFYRHPQMADGHLNKCKECTMIDVRKNYSNRKTQYHAYDRMRYRNSKERYLDHIYNGIVQRCEGRCNRSYRVCGTVPLSREEWEKFCKETDIEFMELYDVWKKSGFKRSLAPSIDRVNNDMGYEINNMQWLTQSANSSKRDSTMEEWKEKYERKYNKRYPF